MAPGRVSALSLPVGSSSAVECRAYARRTPVFTVSAGQVLVSLTLPEYLRAEHVTFARSLAGQAAVYAVEVERRYRNGIPAGRAA